MKRIGLVLGAGGMTGGAFHAGVLSALAEATGWEPRQAEIVVGTSAGSLAGAVIRAGMAAADLRNRTLGRPLSTEGRQLTSRLAPPPAGGFRLRPEAGASSSRRRSAAPAALARMALRPWDVRPAVVMSALLPPGRISTDVITGGMEPLFGNTWPKDPFWICAVRLDTGRRVVFGRDPSPSPTVGEAVAASCAIPSYFAPVAIEGVDHVDGGVHSPTNLDVLGGLGLDLVIVSSPMSQAGRSLPQATADWAVRRFCRGQLDREAVAVRRRGTPVLALQPTPEVASVMGLNAMDPGRRLATVEAAYESTRRRLGRADVRDRLAALS